MEIVMVGVEILRRALCRCGPYLFVELVMPGGTLLALLMYLYQRHAAKKEAGTLSISPAVERP
jgi:hypothetical protein